MWQCKHCKERYVEEPKDHLCVNDQLSHHFKGRRAVLEPLFRAFLQKLERLQGVRVSSDKTFITLAGKKPFGIARVAEDRIEIFLKLPVTAPISPALTSAVRLHISEMTHFFTLKSIADITPDIMRSVMWSKDAADNPLKRVAVQQKRA